MKSALAWICCENSHTRKHNSASYASYKNTGCFAVLTSSGKALATKLLWSKSSLVNRTLSPEGTVESARKRAGYFYHCLHVLLLKNNLGQFENRDKTHESFYDVDVWVD